jgi:hypothetical protein
LRISEVSVFAIVAALAAIAAVFAITTWARREAVQLPRSPILRVATTSGVSVAAELARREIP